MFTMYIKTVFRSGYTASNIAITKESRTSPSERPDDSHPYFRERRNKCCSALQQERQRTELMRSATVAPLKVRWCETGLDAKKLLNRVENPTNGVMNCCEKSK